MGSFCGYASGKLGTYHISEVFSMDLFNAFCGDKNNIYIFLTQSFYGRWICLVICDDSLNGIKSADETQTSMTYFAVVKDSNGFFCTSRVCHLVMEK